MSIQILNNLNKHLLGYAAFIGIGVLLYLGFAQPAFSQTQMDGVFEGSFWEQFEGGAKAVCADDDIDNDNDGLIELCYLEDVNVIRHALDGSGYKASAMATTSTVGCPIGGCNGYELVRDLDFNDNDSYRDTATNKLTWTMGGGWVYIPGTFSGILEGNGYIISNLFVNSITGNARAGRFIEQISGHVRNLGLADVNITITRGNQRGAVFTYALQGSASITNCYISGMSNNMSPSDDARFSAFVQDNSGKIFNSYVDMKFIGKMRGLFVGENRIESVQTKISNSYIIGDTRRATGAGNLGFTAVNKRIIEKVYYAVESQQNNGHAITDENNSGTVRNSYYDNDKWRGNQLIAVNGTISNSGGFGTTRLQAETGQGSASADPYYQWSDDDWDFGTDSEYPAVKYAIGDNNNPACRVNLSLPGSQQPLCGALLRGQKNTQPRITYPPIGTQIAVNEGDTNIDKTIHVELVDDDVADLLTLSLFAMDKNQTLVELMSTTTVIILPNSNRERSAKLPINVPVAGTAGSMAGLILVVEDNSGLDNARSEEVSLKVVTVATGSNTPPTITSTVPTDIELTKGAGITFDVTVEDADMDPFSMSISGNNDTVATATIIAIDGATRTLRLSSMSTGTAVITVTVDDGRGETNSKAAVPFTVVVVGTNEPPTLNILSEPDSILQLNSVAKVDVSVTDADYDTYDIVTLTARSSAPSVLSVIEPAEISGIASTESRTFRLNVRGAGSATITITATDISGASAETMFDIQINASPMIVSYNPNPFIAKLSRDRMLGVTVSDEDVMDVLALELRAMDPNQDIVELVTTNTTVETNGSAQRTQQMFTVKGLKPGSTTLTLIIRDPYGISAETSVLVTVEENTAPTISRLPDNIVLIREINTAFTVTVEDADTDDAPADLTLSVTSDNPEIAAVAANKLSDGVYRLTITSKSILGTTTMTVTVNDGRNENSMTSDTFTVEVAETDGVFRENSWDLYEGDITAVCDDADVDNDDDGLIELCYLEDVNAIRHALDGSGYKFSGSAAKITTGCGGGIDHDTCFGYELIRNLDFNDDDSYVSTTNKVTWTQGSGWPFIAGTFSSILEGNGYIISNLFVSAESEAPGSGRFIQDTSGHIRNLGLADVNVTIAGGETSSWLGAILTKTLSASASITNCYVSGRLDSMLHFTGSKYSAFVQNNSGKISNSYVNMDFSGQVYGLFVGDNTVGTVINSYIRGDAKDATSAVRVDTDFFGLVARNKDGGMIEKVYYAVETDANAGYSLARINTSGSIGNSYFNSDKWQGDTAVAPGGTISNSEGFSTMELQMPTSPGTTTATPYYDWSTDNWDFGTDSEYPAVRYAIGDDSGNPACGTSQQPVCGTLLSGQRNNQPSIISPSAGTVAITPRQEQTINVDVTVADDDVDDRLTLSLSALDRNQEAVALVTTTTEVVEPNGFPTRDLQTLELVVPAESAELIRWFKLVAEDDSGLDNTISEAILLRVEGERNTTPTITKHDAEVTAIIGRERTINVELSDSDVADTLTVELVAVDTSQQIVRIVDASVSVPTNSMVARMPQELTIEGIADGTTTLTIVVTDGQGGRAEASVVVTSRMNAQPTIDGLPEKDLEVRRGTSQTVAITVADDDADDAVGDLTVSATSSDADVASVDVESVGEGRYELIITAKAMLTTATITVSVDDGNNESNSIISESFIVKVVEGPVVIGGLSEVVIVVPVDETSIVESVNYFNALSTSTLSYTATDVPADRFSFNTGNGQLTITPDTTDISTDPAGIAIIVTATDSFGMATLTFKILVDATATGDVSIAPSGTDKWLLEATHTVTDANNGGNQPTTQPSYQWYRDDTPVGDGSASYAIENTAAEREADTEYRVVMMYTDNIGQETSFDSDPYTVENIAPTIRAEESLSVSVSEGASTTVDVEIADENLDTLNLVLESSNETTATATIVETSGAKRTLRINGLKIGTATITATVDDGKGATDEVVFIVNVVMNTAPIITINLTDDQILPLGEMLELSISVMDANYDAGDEVTITVATTPSSVLVIDPMQIDEIMTNSTQTIALTALVGGNAVLTITATDRGGASTSTMLSVRVEASLMIATIDAITANEGDTVTITPDVSDANDDDLLYAWRVMSGDNTSRILQGVTIDAAELSFPIPADYIEDTDNDNAMHELIFELKVTEDKANPTSATQTAMVTITKIDNDDATLDPITTDREDNSLLMFSEIDETSDGDGDITTSTIMYQWQLCVATTLNCSTSGWTDISEATDTSYNIDESSAIEGNRYRMEVTYTDGQGYPETLYSTEHTYTTGIRIRIRTKVFLEGPLR